LQPNIHSIYTLLATWHFTHKSLDLSGHFTSNVSSHDISRSEPCPARVIIALHKQRRPTIQRIYKQRLRSNVRRCREIARVCVDPQDSPFTARTDSLSTTPQVETSARATHARMHFYSTACASVKPYSPRLRSLTRNIDDRSLPLDSPMQQSPESHSTLLPKSARPSGINPSDLYTSQRARSCQSSKGSRHTANSTCLH